MPAIIIILCIIALIALLLSRKITLRITYNNSLNVVLKFLFFEKQLYPNKEKKRKRYPQWMSKRKARKIKEEYDKKHGKRKPRKILRQITEAKEDEELEKNDILSILSIILNFIKSFIKLFATSIRIKASRLRVVVASEDAAETALLYASATQAVNVIFPLLDSLRPIKKLPRGKDLSIDIDFLADEPTIDVEIELYIRLIRGIVAILGAFIKAFKKAVKDQMKRLERQK